MTHKSNPLQNPTNQKQRRAQHALRTGVEQNFQSVPTSAQARFYPRGCTFNISPAPSTNLRITSGTPPANLLTPYGSAGRSTAEYRTPRNASSTSLCLLRTTPYRFSRPRTLPSRNSSIHLDIIKGVANTNFKSAPTSAPPTQTEVSFQPPPGPCPPPQRATARPIRTQNNLPRRLFQLEAAFSLPEIGSCRKQESARYTAIGPRETYDRPYRRARPRKRAQSQHASRLTRTLQSRRRSPISGAVFEPLATQT